MLSEDASTSHLPTGRKANGAPLRMIHHDVYMALRVSSMCTRDKCDLFGSPSPAGK